MLQRIRKNGIKCVELLVIAGIALQSLRANAQTLVGSTVSGTFTSGSYYNGSSITLLPNTDITPGPGQSVEFYVSNCQPLTTAYATNTNYIITTTPRVNTYAPGGSYTGCDVMRAIQYYDGLGRPLQTVLEKASPLGFDLVQPFTYDQFGREDKKYLPYAATSADGSYKADALTPNLGVFNFYRPGGTGNSGDQQVGGSGIVVIPTPYAQTVFEPSPLNRIMEQGAPGDAWKLRASGGHTVMMEYGANNDMSWASNPGTSRQVKKYSTTVNVDFSQTLTNIGFYDPNMLFVTIIKDENWTSGRAGTTEEYKDKDGRVVLKRAYNYNIVTATLEKLSTYYVYDDYGNLAFVLPPGADPDAGLTSAANQPALDNLCYQYQYDQRNRLVSKRLPGKGWEEAIYNKLDQVVYTQDALQRGRSERSFTKYDGAGRVIISGIELNHTSSWSTIQAIVSTGTGRPWEERTASGGFHGYTNTSFPGNTFNMKPLTVNYYDRYTDVGFPTNYTAISGSTTATHGLPVASKTAVLEGVSTNYGTMLWNVNYYDDRGRNIHSYAQHYVGGSTAVSQYNYDRISITYDPFTSEVTKVIRLHYIKNTGNTAATLKSNIEVAHAYDHMGRKLTTKQRVSPDDILPATATLLSKLDYNEIGQLKKKWLHSTDDGSTFLQAISYAYNERGWLQKSVAPLFEEELKYNTVSTGKQYNGNIASQTWRTGALSPQTYTYEYDNLNRLTSGMTGNGYYGENEISYDRGGNIEHLKRTVNNAVVDNLTYNYLWGGDKRNRLQNVTDGITTTGLLGFRAGAGGYNYNYDANGNMLTDASKGLTLGYNPLNLPGIATIVGQPSNGTITYTFDASGNKLRKVAAGSSTVTTQYVSGIQYNNDAIESVQTEEGRILSITSSSANYEYALTDHLGNTRVTFDSAMGSITPKQVDDYLPFGMDMAMTAPSVKNKYLYNRKELQDEFGFNQYDYGARFYDPVIARWGSVDIMAEKYNGWSTYAYVLNNPTRFVDPDGTSTYVIQNSDGSYRVVGGNTEDHDRNIYVLSFKDNKYLGMKSIGKSATMTSFYNADKDENGKEFGWMGTIKTKDNTGRNFLNKLVTDDPSLGDYIENAEGGQTYDFKRTNGTDKQMYRAIGDFYRGMPIATDEDGTTVYGSARDVGNIAAGYVVGRLAVSWERAREEFDKLESKQKGRPSIETIGTQNAQRLGWETGIRDSMRGYGALPYRWLRAIPFGWKRIKEKL